MTNTTQCPKCETLQVKQTYHPPYQEYPGASVQDGYTYIECPHCGWEDIVNSDLSDFNYMENTRGW